jgi:hypothetical protein
LLAQTIPHWPPSHVAAPLAVFAQAAQDVVTLELTLVLSAQRPEQSCLPLAHIALHGLD